jgi:hypothetical protein
MEDQRASALVDFEGLGSLGFAIQADALRAIRGLLAPQPRQY